MPRPRAALESAIALAGFTVAATAPEDASLHDQWRIALSSLASIVFVAGGDGTLGSAAAHLARTGKILAPVPAGTMNRFAIRLGLPPDPLAAIAAMAEATACTVPLACINGVPFLHQCIAGRVTWLMRVRERMRDAGLRGWLGLLRAMLREVLRPPADRSLVARIGRRHVRAHTAVATAPAPGDAALIILKLAPRRRLPVRLRQAWRWFRGRLAEDPDILVRLGPRLAIASAATLVRVSIDGEVRLLHAPLRLRLHAGALRILRPHPPTGP